MTALLVTISAGNYLADKNKELIGGDVSIESNFVINEETKNYVLGKENIIKESTSFTFPSIINSNTQNLPVSIKVVDDNYPLYGALILFEGEYEALKENEVYIDKATASKLGLQKGNTIIFSNKEYIIKGSIKSDSAQLLAGFSFLPKVIMSEEGFMKSGLTQSFIRAEYKTNVNLGDQNTNTKKEIVERGLENNLNIDVAGVTTTGFIEGLSAVERFLVLAVLLVCILSAVNMYAGIMYLLTILRKSLATLLSLGLSKRKLSAVVSLSFGYIIMSAIFIGGLLSIVLVSIVLSFAQREFDISLVFPPITTPLALTAFVLISVSVAAFVPSIRSLLALTPKELLSGGTSETSTNNLRTLVFITVSTLFPLVLIAIVLLEDIFVGILGIGALVFLYVFVATLIYILLQTLYKKRNIFSLIQRSVISFKKSDGVFGIVSLTSLYVALSALAILILLQATLLSFLNKDLGQRVPGVYIIDVQKSQVNDIKNQYSDITLFPNVGARIISIDDKDIQAALTEGNEGVDRELGREYNLTHRKDLLSSEKITEGKWLSGVKNEVSVEKSFADRAGIRLGSNVTLAIQGFNIVAQVTSIREADTRSGLPFFYFVFNTEDLEQYPSTFFGYAFYDNTKKESLLAFLAQKYPNVSVIDTEEVAVFAKTIIGALTLIVFIIAIPPLVLALFLIVTLVITSFSSRRKASAQFEALGAERLFIKKMYYLETLFGVLVGSLLGYITGAMTTIIITKYYLKLPSFDIFDIELFGALLVIIVSIIIVAYILWKSDKRSVREILSYEEN